VRPGARPEATGTGVNVIQLLVGYGPDMRESGWWM
jgi:hypothetical protein